MKFSVCLSPFSKTDCDTINALQSANAHTRQVRDVKIIADTGCKVQMRGTIIEPVFIKVFDLFFFVLGRGIVR